MEIQELLTNGNWQEFDLKMTKLGCNDFSYKVRSQNQEMPQVYVHVSIDNTLYAEVLRIGSAKNGIVNRWVKSTNGHLSTFLYSIGESNRYKNSAVRYPNYLIFFAGLKELNTKLYVVTCNSVESMKTIEKELTQYYKPIWETKEFKRKKTFRGCFDANPTIEEKIVILGGAVKMINSQRNNTLESAILPDVHNFKSDIKWNV